MIISRVQLRWFLLESATESQPKPSLFMKIVVFDFQIILILRNSGLFFDAVVTFLS